MAGIDGSVSTVHLSVEHPRSNMSVGDRILEELGKPDAADGVHVRGLADRLDVAQSTITYWLDKLEDEGTIKTERKTISKELGPGMKDWQTEVRLATLAE